jgi:hypothetical protein
MEVDLKLDEKQMNELLQGAILQALGEKAQKAIIDDVIKTFTTRRSASGYYGGEPSTPLQDMLRECAGKVARAVITDRFEKDPEFIAQIESLYAEAARRFVCSENREKLISRVVNSMIDSLGRS